MPDSTLTSHPILLVDKEGTFGELLVKKTQETHLTILVSSKEIEPVKNLIYVPFKKRIPKIPDNTFSQIILCYQGEKELQEALPSFILKAKENNARLTIVTDIFHYKENLSQKLFQHYTNAQVIVVGDMFGSDFTTPTPVNTLLLEAKTTGKVVLFNNGLSFLYPVFEEDVAEGLAAVLFSLSEPQQTYLLFSKHPVTALSFVRSLEKTYPLLGIDFLRGNRKEVEVQIPDGVSVFGSSYPLSQRLKAIDLTHTPLFKKTEKKKKIKRVKQKRPVFLFISLLFFILSLPLLSSVGLAMGGGALLLSAQNSLEKGEIESAKSSAQAAASLLGIADQSVSTLRGLTSVVGLQGEVLGFQSTIHTGKIMSDAFVEGIEGIQTIQKVFQGNSSNGEGEFIEGLGMVKESVRSIQQLQVEGQIPDSYKNKVKAFEKPFVLFLNTADAYPTLFGFDKPKTYLVLFQNNYELRPTGGFIGSYGILKVERGRVLEFHIEDVYNADGKLTADIEPPFPYQRYMGATHWFLRDSNYAIDFPTSAANSASFLEMETGQKVDGVFAVDVSFIASLLHATGPLKISDYNETLTPENFFLTTEKHVEQEFFPGSTQKKDYLKSVQRALESRFKEGKLNYQKLLSLIISGVEEKHVLFAFSDPSIQRLFSVNNLSGALTDLRQSSRTVFLDTVGVNEANIGLNKGNYYIKRTIDQEVTVDGDGKVSGEVIVSYQNTSKQQDPFGGEYKAYLRYILPEGALLREIQIDGVVQPAPQAEVRASEYKAPRFKAPAGVEVERVSQDKKTFFGLLVTVPMQQTKKVTLVYDLTQKISVDDPTFSYDLWVIKQPGTLADPYRLSLSYPVATRLLQSSSPVNDVGGKLIFETTLKEDKHLILYFGQR